MGITSFLTNVQNIADLKASEFRATYCKVITSQVSNISAQIQNETLARWVSQIIKDGCDENVTRDELV